MRWLEPWQLSRFVLRWDFVQPHVHVSLSIGRDVSTLMLSLGDVDSHEIWLLLCYGREFGVGMVVIWFSFARCMFL